MHKHTPKRRQPLDNESKVIFDILERVREGETEFVLENRAMAEQLKKDLERVRKMLYRARKERAIPVERTWYYADLFRSINNVEFFQDENKVICYREGKKHQ